jgi:hypothetical protein
MSHADWEMFCRGRSSQDDEPVRLEPDDAAEAGADASVRHVTTRIVGISYPNPDGTGRRDAVRALRRLDRVRLVHRPDNPVDPNAIAVLRDPDGHQLGYLPAAHASEMVAPARDRGTRFLALVAAISGDADDMLSVGAIGAEVVLLVLEAGATKAMARQYLLGLLRGRRATSVP